MRLHDIVKVLLILSIWIIGAGIMFSSTVLGRPVEEKAVFALIGLFVIAIVILFLYLYKDALLGGIPGDQKYDVQRSWYRFKHYQKNSADGPLLFSASLEHGHSFGGRCFPKDLNAIIAMFNEGHMHNPVLLKAARKVNGRIGNQRN